MVQLLHLDSRATFLQSYQVFSARRTRSRADIKRSSVQYTLKHDWLNDFISSFGCRPIALHMLIYHRSVPSPGNVLKPRRSSPLHVVRSLQIGDSINCYSWQVACIAAATSGPTPGFIEASQNIPSCMNLSRIRSVSALLERAIHISASTTKLPFYYHLISLFMSIQARQIDTSRNQANSLSIDIPTIACITL